MGAQGIGEQELTSVDPDGLAALGRDRECVFS